MLIKQSGTESSLHMMHNNLSQHCLWNRGSRLNTELSLRTGKTSWKPVEMPATPHPQKNTRKWRKHIHQFYMIYSVFRIAAVLHYVSNTMLAVLKTKWKYFKGQKKAWLQCQSPIKTNKIGIMPPECYIKVK